MSKKLLGTLLILTGFQLSYAGGTLDDGKAIFTSRCVNCHNINKVFVGPALADVHKRHSIDWIIKFVQSSQTVIKSGDKDAVALFTKYKITMPDHSDLSADNIKGIVEYIKSESGVVPVAAVPVPAPKSRTFFNLFSTAGYGIITGYLAAFVLLIASLLLFIKVKRYERTKVW